MILFGFGVVFGTVGGLIAGILLTAALFAYAERKPVLDAPVSDRRVHLIACTQQDIEWLWHCRGCLKAFPDEPQRQLHEQFCTANRDFVIEQKLRAQRRDDGLPDDEDDQC